MSDFNLFYEEQYPDLRTYSVRLVRKNKSLTSEDAIDLLNDAFISVKQHWDGIKQNPILFAETTIRNKFIDLCRKTNARNKAMARYNNWSSQDSITQIDNKSEWEVNEDKKNREIRMGVGLLTMKRCIEKLPPKDQKIIRAILEDKHIADIVNECGETNGYVRNCRTRFINLVRKELDRNKSDLRP